MSGADKGHSPIIHRDIILQFCLFVSCSGQMSHPTLTRRTTKLAVAGVVGLADMGFVMCPASMQENLLTSREEMTLGHASHTYPLLSDMSTIGRHVHYCQTCPLIPDILTVFRHVHSCQTCS